MLSGDFSYIFIDGIYTFYLLKNGLNMLEVEGSKKNIIDFCFYVIIQISSIVNMARK